MLLALSLLLSLSIYCMEQPAAAPDRIKQRAIVAKRYFYSGHYAANKILRGLCNRAGMNEAYSSKELFEEIENMRKAVEQIEESQALILACSYAHGFCQAVANLYVANLLTPESTRSCKGDRLLKTFIVSNYSLHLMQSYKLQHARSLEEFDEIVAGYKQRIAESGIGMGDELCAYYRELGKNMGLFIIANVKSFVNKRPEAKEEADRLMAASNEYAACVNPVVDLIKKTPDTNDPVYIFMYRLYQESCAGLIESFVQNSLNIDFHVLQQDPRPAMKLPVFFLKSMYNNYKTHAEKIVSADPAHAKAILLARDGELLMVQEQFEQGKAKEQAEKLALSEKGKQLQRQEIMERQERIQAQESLEKEGLIV